MSKDDANGGCRPAAVAGPVPDVELVNADHAARLPPLEDVRDRTTANNSLGAFQVDAEGGASFAVPLHSLDGPARELLGAVLRGSAKPPALPECF